MAVIEMNIYSQVLNMNMDVCCIFPDEIPKGNIKTLWLYHGGSGDHEDWMRATRINDLAAEHKIAVVMPWVHQSCFVDMEHGGRYGTYAGEELFEIIHTLMPALSDNRKDNALSGFSNGGYGSLITGMTYPKLYGYIGAFAAGDKSDNEFLNDGSQRDLDRIVLFGDGDMKETKYCIPFRADRILKTGDECPCIYHGCGKFDPWMDKNMLLRRYFEGLADNPFSYHFKEYTMHAHTNIFRERALEDFLDYIRW